MKTERDKAFEKYVMSLRKFKNRKPVFVFQLDENGDYDNRDVYDLHHAWIASAQRDGYKLVPVDPPEGMDIKICRLVDHRIDVFEADRIYKAMIGAAE